MFKGVLQLWLSPGESVTIICSYEAVGIMCFTWFVSEFL
jgi:hypothetical protein